MPFRPVAALLLLSSLAAAQPDPLPEHALARFGTVRFRTGCSVRNLAFSPDGKAIASWGNATSRCDEFSLWDAATGRELRSLRTVSFSFEAWAWPAAGPGLVVFKGKEILRGGEYRSADLWLWDFTASPPSPLPKPDQMPDFVSVPRDAPPPAGYGAVDLSADGKRLAVATGTGDKPGVIAIYEARPAKSLSELKRLAELDAPPAVCNGLGFTPDGKRLVGSCPDDKAVRLIVWDVTTGKIVRTFNPPAAWAGSIAITNTAAAFGLESGDTLIGYLNGGKDRTVATAHKVAKDGEDSDVLSLAFLPDGKGLVSCGADGLVRLTDVATGKVTHTFGRHRDRPRALAVSPDGKRAASAGKDGLIHLWDVTSGKAAFPTGVHERRVEWVAASADGKVVVTECGDEAIHMWDPATGKERRTIAVGEPVHVCRLTPDGTQIVAATGPVKGATQSFRMWDLATGADITPAGLPKTLPPSGLRLAPDGRTMLTYTGVSLAGWAWPAGTKLWATDMPKADDQVRSYVIAVATSPDGHHFVTAGQWWAQGGGDRRARVLGSDDVGIIDLWETATGKHVRRLAEANVPYSALVFAPDGTLILHGYWKLPNDVRRGRDGKPVTAGEISVIDPRTGKLVREFAHSWKNYDGLNDNAFALSADGRVLFRAMNSGDIQVYEVATGRLRSTLSGHRNEVLSLAVPTNDVRRLLSGSTDTTALWWDVGFHGEPKTFTAGEHKYLWKELAEPNAKWAAETMTKLAGDPAGFVALAAAELKPAPPGPTEADLAPHFKNLNAKSFAAREAAAKALDRYGETALPQARAQLEKETSAEARERLTKFIDRHTKPDNDPERLRQGRAVELLEHLGTPEAKELLTKLAKGGPAKLTADAAGAVKRLASR